jgi:hypothetical protein
MQFILSILSRFLISKRLESGLVAQSHTPHDHCVRFVMVVAFHNATLVTGRALPLSRTGLSPAGPCQLRLAHRYSFTVTDLHRLPPAGLPALRGSIAHPTQSLCTLRGRRCRRLTQHSLPGDPLRPYPDWSSTGWIAPVSLAPSGIRSSARRSDSICGRPPRELNFQRQ